MTPELKSKWLAALRSGDYQQGRETMHRGKQFCCLGVLCDVAGYDWVSIGDKEGDKEGDAMSCQAGQDYIENTYDRYDKLGLSDLIHEACYSMNDGTFKLGDEERFGIKEQRTYSFAEIADYLEKKL